MTAITARAWALALALLVLGAALPAQAAGPVERACLQAARPGASRALCNCIQRAADATLSRGDQRMAASFFRDPDRAQQIRQSDRVQHEDFWQRYKGFASTAEYYCRG